VSQQELDDAVRSNLANLASIAAAKGKFDHTKAAVTAAEAQIGVARSSLQAAELNLAFTKVKSPVNVSSLSEVTRRDTPRVWIAADRRVTFDRAV
jgi:multidrug resistance efflux pump